MSDATVTAWTVGDDQRWCPEHGWGCHCNQAVPAGRRWQHTIDDDLLDQPALGAHLGRPDTAERRAAYLTEGRWHRNTTLADHRARHAAAELLHDLYDIALGLVRDTRRPDVAAAHLRHIAQQIADIADQLDQHPARLAHDPEAA